MKINIETNYFKINLFNKPATTEVKAEGNVFYRKEKKETSEKCKMY